MKQKLIARPQQTRSMKEFFDGALAPQVQEFYWKKAAKVGSANNQTLRTEAAKESAKEGKKHLDTQEERRQKMENTKKQIMEKKENKKKKRRRLSSVCSDENCH